MEDNTFLGDYDISKLTRLTTHGKKRLLREKDLDKRKTYEQALDGRTLTTLYELTKKKIIYRLGGPIGSGKESKIFLAKDFDDKDIALKVFLTSTAEFKKRLPYILGDRRFEGMKKNGYWLIKLWAKKEYVNLNTAFYNSVNVPKPITVLNNVLAMEFIGKEGKKAPLLADVEPTKTDYLKVVEMIRRLYFKAKLVHSDLSEHNIFKLGSEIYFFDFGSAVVADHPNALEFLLRDVRNVNRFFIRNGIEVFDEKRILKGVRERWP
ncbi:MAG: serine protein kinase RIO [Nitrososphaeria archaeon]|jgi:RIO kinase 1